MRKLLTASFLLSLFAIYVIAQAICGYRIAAFATRVGTCVSIAMAQKTDEKRIRAIIESGTRIPEELVYSSRPDGSFVLTSRPFREGAFFTRRVVVTGTPERKVEVLPFE